MSKPARKAGRPAKYDKEPGEERSVKRFQVSFRPTLFKALEAFRKDQPFPVERSAIIERLLENFLRDNGYYKPESNGDGK